MRFICHGRGQSPPSSWPDLFRPSTSLNLHGRKTWVPATGAGMTAERQCTRRTKKRDERPSFVMAGLVPAIHVFACFRYPEKTWMPATSAGMTVEGFIAGMTGERQCVSFVMAGLVPAIHVFAVARPQDVDARDKRGHDGREAVRFNSSWPGLSRPSTSLLLQGC